MLRLFTGICRAAFCVGSLCTLGLAGTASAKDIRARPEVISQLIECLNVTDNAARLSCLETATRAIDAAERNRQITIVDKQQIRETRRSLFGLQLPTIKIFGGNDAEEEEFRQIETIIRQAQRGPHGEWIVTLEDGARWRQVDGNTIMSPKPGQPIRIREGSLGSYVANINKQNGIKVRREN